MSEPIVVGVDGSDASREALRWAAEEARLRSVPLVARPRVVVRPAAADRRSGAASPCLSATFPVSWMQSATPLPARSTGRSPKPLQSCRGSRSSERLVEGDAGDALVAESESAQLVVVGSHGRTGFRAALLGSVSRHVVNHAACPVVVVKASS